MRQESGKLPKRNRHDPSPSPQLTCASIIWLQSTDRCINKIQQILLSVYCVYHAGSDLVRIAAVAGKIILPCSLGLDCWLLAHRYAGGIYMYVPVIPRSRSTLSLSRTCLFSPCRVSMVFVIYCRLSAVECRFICYMYLKQSGCTHGQLNCQQQQDLEWYVPVSECWFPMIFE